MSFTPQTNGDLYASEVLFDHYQVMESNIPQGTYYVIDHHLSDFLVRENGKGSPVKRYASIEEAIKSFTPLVKSDKSPNPVVSPVISTQEESMARVKTTETIAEPVEKKRGRKPAEGGVSGTARRLIRENDAKKVKERKTDTQLNEDLRAALPDKKIAAGTIAYYRKKMAERAEAA